MKVGVTDPSGNRKEYRIKPLDDLTLADWVVLTQPDAAKDEVDGFEQLLRLVSRHTTIPRKALNKMPAKDVRLLVDAMAATLDEVSKAREKAERMRPQSFEFQGVTYMVPQSIEDELTFGQEQSLTNVMLPACETDAEGYAAILAATCLPEGEEFDGSKMAERKALFMGVPLRTAMEVCAFFFDSSERLRISIAHIAMRSRSSWLRRVGLALTNTRSSTVH